MIGFHITVPGMKKQELINFVHDAIPSTKELVRRAKLAKLPEKCTCCDATLHRVSRRYKRIPTKDSGLTFPKDQPRMRPQVMQLASGGHDCRRMREGVCRIVHKQLLRRLRAADWKVEQCII